MELAARGKEVIGVDASPEMLSQAREKSGECQPPVLYLCQEMEELDLYGTVDAAICMLDSLNHLEGEEALGQALHRLQYFVEPGGLFLFDMNTPYKHREVLGDNTFVYDTDQVYCVWQNTWSPEEGAVDIDLDFLFRMKKAATTGRWRVSGSTAIQWRQFAACWKRISSSCWRSRGIIQVLLRARRKNGWYMWPVGCKGKNPRQRGKGVFSREIFMLPTAAELPDFCAVCQ